LGDWLRCVAVASSVLWLRELSKMLIRATNRRLSPKDVQNSEPL
jgi:hypothetical protein